jgi:hypothetical protein
MDRPVLGKPSIVEDVGVLSSGPHRGPDIVQRSADHTTINRRALRCCVALLGKVKVANEV